MKASHLRSAQHPARPPQIESRRRFLQSTSALTLAALGASLPQGVWAAGSGMIRVGLIGCGNRGTGAAINALDADPGAKLVAVAELFGDKLEASLAKITAKHPQRGAVDADHRFVGFDGYKHVIESSDVVLIACASKFHPRYLREAVEAGRHVFVEKPHGIDPAGVQATQAAADLARTKGLCVMSGLHNRYDTGVRETMRRIHDGAIGDVVAMEVNFLRAPYVVVKRQPGWSEIEYQFRNWYHFAWLSGDDVTQSLVHSVDKAAWVMHDQPPVFAHGFGGRSASFGEEFGDMFDHHAVVYTYEKGVRLYAFCRTQAGCHGGVSDTIIGTKGRAELLHYRITGETNIDVPAPKVNPYLQEQKELFAAIRAGTPINSGDYMAKSTMLAVLGQIACYTGRQLSWKKAAASDFAFPPLDGNFQTEPPVQPGPDGLYPVPIPGKTKLIAGT
jgi:predicted dehydrogenase